MKVRAEIVQSDYLGELDNAVMRGSLVGTIQVDADALFTLREFLRAPVPQCKHRHYGTKQVKCNEKINSLTMPACCSRKATCHRRYRGDLSPLGSARVFSPGPNPSHLRASEIRRPSDVSNKLMIIRNIDHDIHHIDRCPPGGAVQQGRCSTAVELVCLPYWFPDEL